MSKNNTIYVDFGNKPEETINLQQIKTQRRETEIKAPILPATEVVERELFANHTPEAIKDERDIYRLSQYFIDNQKWRDNMLFICGINLGRRISDLLDLRFCDFINPDYTFKLSFPIIEKKTKRTRARHANCQLTINDAVIDAIMLYLEHHKVHLSDYMFRREDANKDIGKNEPLSRVSVDRILKSAAKEVGLDIKIASNTLRKTFGYHQLLRSGNDPRMLYLLMDMFGHSSIAITLKYIGVTSDEVAEAYLNLNLGLRDPEERISLVDSQIG